MDKVDDIADLFSPCIIISEIQTTLQSYKKERICRFLILQSYSQISEQLLSHRDFVTSKKVSEIYGFSFSPYKATPKQSATL